MPFFLVIKFIITYNLNIRKTNTEKKTIKQK